MLIGIVALIFLGPRKLPELARKMGKMMNEFRSTTNEFKSTWEREVNFEDETNALRTGELATETAPDNTIHGSSSSTVAPAIKSIDREAFEALAPHAVEESRDPETVDEKDEDSATDQLADKRTWL